MHGAECDFAMAFATYGDAGRLDDLMRAAANRTLLAGPPSTVQPLDEDAIVAEWRAAQDDDRRRSR
jgi:hypothetical protein